MVFLDTPSLTSSKPLQIGYSPSVSINIFSGISLFLVIGIIGDWEKPYITMDYKFEADIVRALGKIINNGHLQKGDKPVHWCVDCKSKCRTSICIGATIASNRSISRCFFEYSEKHSH